MAHRLLLRIGIVAWIFALSLSAYYAVYLPSKDTNATRCPSFGAFTRSRFRNGQARLIGMYISEMRPIPAGKFCMGSMTSRSMSQPVHVVGVQKFVMGRTPVTVGMWKEFCLATNQKMPAPPPWGWIDDHPMVNISYDDVVGFDGNGGFCAWASSVTGIRLSLPSEAQFEYVARGGQNGNEYPWGNKFEEKMLWCSTSINRTRTAPVKRENNIFTNKFGVSDMSGNVFQWCANPFFSYAGDRPSEKTNGLEYTPDKYVFRGTGFSCSETEYANVGNRFVRFPWRWDYDLGFRLCINGDSVGP
jgi:sulfatase modifying factor 1